MRTFQQVATRYATHPEMVGIVLESPNTLGSAKDALLHLAARMGQAQDVRDLIRLGGRIDLPGDRGFTPLHYAAAAGHASVVAVLLDLGANLDAKNEWDQTALEVAMLADQAHLFELL